MARKMETRDRNGINKNKKIKKDEFVQNQNANMIKNRYTEELPDLLSPFHQRGCLDQHSF